MLLMMTGDDWLSQSVSVDVMSWFFCRGKGDYHRLGHGTDDHVRRPRRVTALQGKKVVSIACGSLHCVCCTDTGHTLILIFSLTVHRGLPYLVTG